MRFALFQKRHYAFLHIRARAKLHRQHAVNLQQFAVIRRTGKAPQHLPRQRDRDGGCFLGNFARQRAGPFQHVFRRHHFAQKTAGQSLVRVEHASRQAPFQGLAQAHQLRQEPCAGRFRYKAAACEHKAETCRAGGDLDVHRQGQGQADAHRRPVERGDGWLAAIVDRANETRPAGAAFARRLIAERCRIAALRVKGVGTGRNIGTGAKAAARARHDDGTNGIIGIGAGEGILQFRPHHGGIGVQLVRPVQRDGQHRSVGFIKNVAIAHGRSSPDDMGRYSGHCENSKQYSERVSTSYVAARKRPARKPGLWQIKKLPGPIGSGECARC